MAAMLLLLLTAFPLSHANSIEESCGDSSSCEVNPTAYAAQGSAMLQVKAGSAPVSLYGTDKISDLEESANSANSGSLEETKACLPAGLQQMHLNGIRRYAALLGSRRSALSVKVSKKNRQDPYDPYGSGDPYGSADPYDPCGSCTTGCNVDGNCRTELTETQCNEGGGHWCNTGSTPTPSPTPPPRPVTLADCGDCDGCRYGLGADECFTVEAGAKAVNCDESLGEVWCGAPPAATPTPTPAATPTPTPAATPTPTPAATPTPTPAATNDDSLPPNALKEAVSAGATVLPVVSNDPFEAGQNIVIDAGSPTQEFNQIVSFGTLVLANPLQFAHTRAVLVDPTSVSGSGAAASLDAAGFKEVTSLCCPSEMEVFFIRLLNKQGYEVCSQPHVQGLMHWFSCVPDMDFQYVLDVIANGNPCKFWALAGAACPQLSPECQGKYCR